MRPAILGVTGCIGAGKSTACAVLAQRGWAVLDVDAVVRTLIDQRGADRAAVLAGVLADPAELARWVVALQPQVVARIDAWAAGLDGAGALESALLGEAGLDVRCDLVLCLRCPADVRRRRVEQRQGPSATRFDAIERAQWPEPDKAARADAELRSDGPPGALAERLEHAVALAERARLRRCWRAMLEVLGGSGELDAVFEALCDRYAEPHRAYHTIAHVAACLRELRGVPLPESDAAVVGLGAFYHDAIYDPYAADNETRSAELAAADLRALGLGAQAERVAALVRATQHHETAEDELAAWLVDVDLAVLAAGARDHADYERGVRKEYERVPADAYTAARGRVLRRFLERPAIYHTAWFRERYEARARANLARAFTGGV